MGQFIAVDWGTSSFRASVIDSHGKVINGLKTELGIAKIPAEKQASYLLELCSSLQNSENNLPYLMCGMVGSTLGMQPVDYVDCPADPKMLVENLSPILHADIQGWIVPGLRCLAGLGEVDVMRGEETQILGWLATQSHSASRVSSATLCLPGTHTKWVECYQNAVQKFATVISGELYDILNNHSILTNGPQQFNRNAFLQGVSRTEKGNSVSHLLFSCRTRVLNNDLAEENSAAYLSGLLIGAEVAAQLQQCPIMQEQTVIIIAQDQLAELYQMALQLHKIRTITQSGDDLVNAGLHFLYQQLIHR